MDLIPWMEQWDMLPEPGGVVLCAVSGGRDSMCLLHYLHTLSRRMDFRVAAGHLNHGMRPTAQREKCSAAGSAPASCPACHNTWRLSFSPAGYSSTVSGISPRLKIKP